jgi:hypothetical protein
MIFKKSILSFTGQNIFFINSSNSGLILSNFYLLDSSFNINGHFLKLNFDSLTFYETIYPTRKLSVALYKEKGNKLKSNLIIMTPNAHISTL